MNNLFYKITIGILLTILVTCLAWLVYHLLQEGIVPTESNKFQFEILKTILVSVVIALLGILIPNQLASKKYEFEQKKEGRRLYSVVSTGLKYLPQRMAVMEYTEAMQHLENIHQAYHLVVLYPDSDDPNIGNYKKYFEKYKIQDLRRAFSGLMCDTKYLESDIPGRIKMIDDKWSELD